MLSVGILGSGYGSSVHMPAILNTKKFKIGGIVSKKKNSSLEVFDSFKRLIEKKPIDIILISTPPSTHFKIGKEIIQTNKAILFEKPFCLNFNEAKELNILLRNNKIKHCIGYQFRYEIVLNKLKKKMKKIGDVKKIKINWIVKKKHLGMNSWKNFNKFGAGVEYNYLPHCLNYLKWLFNFTKIKIMFCKKHNSAPNDFNSSIDLLMLIKKDIEVRIKIKNDVKKSVGHRISIVGTDGVADVFWKYPFDTKNISFSFNGKEQKIFTSEVRNLDTRIHSVQGMWEDFYQFLTKGNEGDLTFSQEALEIHKIINKINNF